VLAYGYQEGTPAPELRWANDGMRALLGYGASALGPAWLLDAIIAEDARLVVAAHQEALRGTPAGLEARFRSADGRVRVLRGELRRADPNDPAAGGLAVWIDVTAERAAREAEARREAEMWRARRVAIIAELTSSVAHDCVNLLTAIRAGCDLLRDELHDARHRKDVTNIAHSADTAATLVQQLLALGSTRAAPPRLIALDDLVANFERVLVRLLGASWPLRLDLGHAGFIHAEASSIEHLLLGVVLGVRDLVREGGSIALATERVVLERPIEGECREIPAGVYAAVVIDVPGPMSASAPAVEDESDGSAISGLLSAARMAEHAGGFVRTIAGEDGTLLQLLFPSCLVSSEPQRSAGAARIRGRRGSSRGGTRPSGPTAA